MTLSDARVRMLERAAREVQPGMVVNLGIGLPTKVVDHLPDDFPYCLHTENGLSGIGPALGPDMADRNLIDAGGAYVSTVPGSAFFDSALSFALVRSGRLDLTMLGAFQVSQAGDLANNLFPYHRKTKWESSRCLVPSTHTKECRAGVRHPAWR